MNQPPDPLSLHPVVRHHSPQDDRSLLTLPGGARPSWPRDPLSRPDFGRSGGEGEAEHEARAAGVVGAVELTAVRASDLARDGQAETGAARITATGIVQADEAFEDALLVGLRDARPVV